jgi:tetratricopeptide (TPR) repeat protein
VDGTRRALESELQAEQAFVAEARQAEKTPKGWPAALLMFHVSMWKERLRNALYDLSEGRPYTPPPTDADEFNEAELANGIGTPLTDAEARSETLHREIIALHETLGDRAFQWYRASTTTEAVLRVAYMHPRNHMYEYWKENGEPVRAFQLYEHASAELREIGAPPLILGAAAYNLATVRAAQGNAAEALALLKEALALRPDLKADAAADSELAALREDKGFQELLA